MSPNNNKHISGSERTLSDSQSADSLSVISQQQQHHNQLPERRWSHTRSISPQPSQPARPLSVQSHHHHLHTVSTSQHSIHRPLSRLSIVSQDAKCLSLLDQANHSRRSSSVVVTNGGGGRIRTGTHCLQEDEALNPLDPNTATPPDGGYGWIVVLASFMCNFTVDGICYTFGLFLPHLMAEFGAGKALTALAGSLLSGCYMTAGLFVSGLVNRFGCRPVAVVGSAVAATSLALSTFVTSVYLLILTYGVITGVFFGLIYLPSIVSVGYYFTTKRALATGIAVCGSGMGAFSFAPLVSWLLHRFAWKVALRILSGLALTCALYGMLMRPLTTGVKQGNKSNNNKDTNEDNGTRKKHRSVSELSRTIEIVVVEHNKDDHRTTEPLGHSHSVMVLHEIESNISRSLSASPEIEEEKKNSSSSSNSSSIFDLGVLRLPAMALLSVANVFGMTGYYIPYVYIAGYAEERVQLGGRSTSPNEAAMLLSAIGVSNVVGRVIFGVIADRAAGRRIRLGGVRFRLSALLINNLCLLVTGLATVAIPFCPEYWSLLGCCVLFGFAISSYMSLTSIILVDLLDLSRLSTTFGLIIFFRGLSSILGPPLAGLLYELTDSYTGVFTVAGALILISALVHAMVHPYQK